MLESLDLAKAEPDSDFGLGAPNSEKARQLAEKENLLVVLPQPNELQLDIDNAESGNVFKRHYQILDKYIGIEKVEEHASRHGGDRKHITVTLKRPVLSLLERIALQAMLGSDRKRELLSLIESELGDETPTLFLEEKEVL